MRADRSTIIPRCLSRKDAAAYVGVSPTAFDALVAAGEMPSPLRPESVRRALWDIRELDAAVDRLPRDGERRQTGRPAVTDWDDVAA